LNAEFRFESHRAVIVVLFLRRDIQRKLRPNNLPYPTSHEAFGMARHVDQASGVLSPPTRLSKALAKKVVPLLRAWWQRTRSRHELSNMTDADLKDLGYPAELHSEKHKPFWRP
jgi:uncharacterized protein YjiS (DUF1127 family)